MASAVATEHIASRRKLKSVITPDAHSAAQFPLWFDMRDFRFLLVQLFFAVKGSSGGITLFELWASDASDGSTNKTQIKVKSVVNDSGANAAGDMINLEVSQEEINQIGRNLGVISGGSGANGIALRYISAKISTVAAADLVVATYLGDEAMFPQDALTIDQIA